MYRVITQKCEKGGIKMGKGSSKLGKNKNNNREQPKSFKNASELKSFVVKSGVKLTKQDIRVLKLLDALY